jgi:hypothetical protein
MALMMMILLLSKGTGVAVAEDFISTNLQQ